MEFSVKSGSPEKQRSACIVVGVFEPRRLSPIAEAAPAGRQMCRIFPPLIQRGFLQLPLGTVPGKQAPLWGFAPAHPDLH